MYAAAVVPPFYAFLWSFSLIFTEFILKFMANIIGALDVESDEARVQFYKNLLVIGSVVMWNVGAAPTVYAMSGGVNVKIIAIMMSVLILTLTSGQQVMDRRVFILCSLTAATSLLTNLFLLSTGMMSWLLAACGGLWLLNLITWNNSSGKFLSEFIELQSRAERATQIKSDFVANMSHELRTPLSSILGYSALLAEHSDLDAQSRGYVDRIRTAGEVLLSTASEVLNFSKLESGQVDVQAAPLDLSRWFGDTLDMLAVQADRKALKLERRLEAGSALQVRIDGPKVRQVLVNLVGNAIKFTEAGTVDVGCCFTPQTGMLKFEVRDTGAGIAPDRQDRLFLRFSQVDGSHARAGAGAGLGLAICRGLVEAMGGRIGVESLVGRGSCFWFEIPAPVVEQPAAAPGAPRLEFMRVLLVSPSADFLDPMCAALTPEGAEIEIARDLATLEDRSTGMKFDLILLDGLSLGGIDAAAAIIAGGPNAGALQAARVAPMAYEIPVGGARHQGQALVDGDLVSKLEQSLHLV